jgi:predicted P-loop ATPase
MRAGRIDIDSIVRDRDMLWAEAFEAAEMGAGVDLTAERLAPDAQRQHEEEGDYFELVGDWLAQEKTSEEIEDAGERNGDGPFRMSDLMRGIGIPVTKTGKKEQMEVARSLRILNYQNVDVWLDGRTQRVWRKAE